MAKGGPLCDLVYFGVQKNLTKEPQDLIEPLFGSCVENIFTDERKLEDPTVGTRPGFRAAGTPSVRSQDP